VTLTQCAIATSSMSRSASLASYFLRFIDHSLRAPRCPLAATRYSAFDVME
jgi:hypothetical protein